MARLVCICGLIVLLAACGKEREPVVHKVGMDDDGKSVSMVVGDQLQVSLPEMEFKGYAWSVRYFDPKSFELMHQKTIGAGAISQSTGGQVTELILFKAIAPGEFTLELDHYLKITTGSPDIRYRLDVTVVEPTPDRGFE